MDDWSRPDGRNRVGRTGARDPFQSSDGEREPWEGEGVEGLAGLGRFSSLEPGVETAPVLSSMEEYRREQGSASADSLSDQVVVAGEYRDGYDVGTSRYYTGVDRAGARGDEEVEVERPGWVRRYLGGISSASTSIWNRLSSRDEETVEARGVEEDTAYRGYDEGDGRALPGRGRTVDPNQKEFDRFDPEHRQHEEVSEFAAGGLVGKDSFGVYTDVVAKRMRHEAAQRAHSKGRAAGDAQRGDGATEVNYGVALNERYKRQLRTYDKDQYGVPLPSTARKFSFSASPESISEVCTGLGVYLVNIRAAIFLAFMLCVLMIYPMVDNITTQNWSSQYYLYTMPNEPADRCFKGYWNTGYTTWIIETSVGGHCDYGPYTSVYGCSNKCVWDPLVLQTAQCASVAGTTYLELYRSEKVCDLHLPCVPSSSNVTAPDGPCFCCELELEAQPTVKNSTDIVVLENNQERIDAGRFWMLFLTQLVFMGWLLVLVHFQVKIVQSNGNNVVGPSDFSVWISGIKPSSSADVYLRKWCQQWGPIMAAFNVPSVGEGIRIGRQVEDILVRKEEADADPGHKSWNPILWIFRRFVVGKPAGLDENLEDSRIKLKVHERQETSPTGYALATFRYTDAAAECINTFDTSPLGRACEMLTCGLTSTKPLLHGSAVEVTRAPEPSDMIWEHTQCGSYEVWRRRIISWAITICVIMAGAGIQYGLAAGAERLREERYIADIAAGNGDESSERDASIKTTRIRVVTMLTGIMVVIINFSTMLTVRFLSWYERWTTRSSMERWVLLKLSFSQLINAFAAPLIAAYVTGNKSGWYVRGGLMEAAFFVQCSNALLPPLVHLLGIGDKFKRYLLAPHARTQEMLNRMLAPPIFPMAEQHAASVTSIGLAMFYMPVLPISPFISMAGLILSYFTNKWIALRRAAAPPNLNGMVTSSLNFLLRLLPLVQLILMKYLYFVGYSSITPVFWTGFAFWIIFMIAPIRALLGTVKRYRRPPVAVGLSYSKLLGGMRLGVGDVYAPVVPKTCSRKFKHQVAETFAQLAPAAFDSILNGEEIAQWINADNEAGSNRFGFERGIQAPWTPSSYCGHSAMSTSHEGLQRQLTQRNAAHASDPSRASITGSIAAGLHETLALLWSPRDPDHPEDVWRRRSRHAVRTNADQATGYGDDDISRTYGYGVDDDMPIRAVYSSSMSRDTQQGRDIPDAHGAEAIDTFAPLGMGSRRFYA